MGMMTQMNNQPTTLKAVLNASNSLIEKHTRLVQFIYNTFGEEGLEELELYSCKIGALIQEQ